MRVLITIVAAFLVKLSLAQGSFAGPVGHASTSAVHKDSSIIKAWATSCNVQRGWQQITDTSLGKVTVGDSSMALGPALSKGVVSLGDGGMATLEFGASLFDGPGPDLLVFENSFLDNFLELAFVEVSSDGQNFFRFPARSLSDTLVQTGGFGYTQAQNVHNLAGKYRAGYGTPFDLAELNGTAGLDLQKITHIRVIDVVGSLIDSVCSRDAEGRKINDPFPTPFPSGGFDLDAVAAIHLNAVGLAESSLTKLNLFPNPVENELNVIGISSPLEYEIRNLQGRLISSSRLRNGLIDCSSLQSGTYLLILRSENEIVTHKIMKL